MLTLQLQKMAYGDVGSAGSVDKEFQELFGSFFLYIGYEGFLMVSSSLSFVDKSTMIHASLL